MSTGQGLPPAAGQQPPAQDQDTEMHQAPAAEPSATRSQPPRPQQSQSAAPAQTQTAEPTDADHDPEPESTPAPEEKNEPPLIPGPRASRLQALFAQTGKHTLDKINKDNFASCFPTIAAKAPGTLEFVQRQMVERLGGLWNKEFETILQNRSVVARLNELESLLSDAAFRRQESTNGSPLIAPHTLPANTILTAHLSPHLTSQQSQLNARLQNTQSANARLWDEIQAQRAEMELLLSTGVEKVLRDVDGANSLLAEVAEELGEETRAAEALIGGVRYA